MTSLPQITFIIGGAASGKSAYAERLAEAQRLPLTYIATAESYDDEMRTKIAAHQARRGGMWSTVEAPRDVAGALGGVEEGGLVLLDCVTLWLTNTILAEADLMTEESALLRALTDCASPVIVVSNEVGAGIVPETSLGRRFRNAQGRLNQTLAARAGSVITVIAGLPLALKGDLPELPA